MYAEIKTYRIPGEEQENKRAPIVWKLDYDVTHAARFESMKNAGRHKHLYRIHRDLTKIAERRIRAFDRGQRMFNSEVNWSAHKVAERMKKLKERSECVNKTLKVKYSYNSDNWPDLN
ncbi:hypothetical protein FSP39_010050 [Pinctada imbricata]|uniref:Uncharacterized protein n=1 Tax=Pinctada imbricata TaxID=66713 RepID=A0AA88XR61_PINIB|nr:hypothetical protein FSP39_010050 [Pinctada imbricata]